MTTEIRRLIFSNEEALEALKAYSQKTEFTLPEGKVVRARFGGNAEYEIYSIKKTKLAPESDYNIKNSQRTVTLTFFSDKTLEQKFCNVTASYLCSALVEYCFKNKIVLPREAEKALDITDFNICLDVNMESFTDEDKPSDRLSLDT